jgi:hypothetical protein
MGEETAGDDFDIDLVEIDTCTRRPVVHTARGRVRVAYA